MKTLMDPTERARCAPKRQARQIATKVDWVRVKHVFTTGQSPDGAPLPSDFPPRPSQRQVAGLFGVALRRLEERCAAERWVENRELFWKEVEARAREANLAYMADALASVHRDIFDASRKYIDIAGAIATGTVVPAGIREALIGVQTLLKAAQTLEIVAKGMAGQRAVRSIGVEDWLAMRKARIEGPVIVLPNRRP